MTFRAGAFCAAAVAAALLFAGSARAKPPEPRGHIVVLGFAGDLGFSGSGDAPSADGAARHGGVIPWDKLTSGVAPLLKADANFANLETVVSPRADLTPIDKAYTFRAEPAALKAALAAGIDVLTAANNHAGDFGAQGILETLRFIGEAKGAGLKAFAGLGMGTERYRADVFSIGSTKVGLGAIGIAYNHAGAAGPGQPLYASPQDFDRVTASLAETGADVRVLSVHYGQELSVLPSSRDMGRLRGALDSGRASIVFAHHSHVPSGVEFRNGRLILYGLGNFLHAGTQDLSRYGICRDFGLYAKAYVWVEPGKQPVIRALEMTPLRGMHAVTTPFTAPEAARRIGILNAMNRAVTGAGNTPVALADTGQGSGLACFGEQRGFGDALAERCRSLPPPVQQSSLDSCRPPPAPETPVQQVATREEQPMPKPSAKPARPAAEKKQKSFFLLKLID